MGLPLIPHCADSVLKLQRYVLVPLAKPVTLALLLLIPLMYVLCITMCASSGERAQIGNPVYRVIDFPAAQEAAGY